MSVEMRKVLILDFWGLGDLVLASGAIRCLQREGYEVGVLCKAISRELMEPYVEDVYWHTYNVPWTVHRGKWHVWKWDWRGLWRVLREIRSESYAASLSIRADPREDFLPYLCGIRKVYGFKRWAWWPLITREAKTGYERHRVMRWHGLLECFLERELPVNDCAPGLADGTRQEGVVLLHVGASAKVRRWPIERWRELIKLLRSYPGGRVERIELIADLDGFGKELAEWIDVVHEGLSLVEMAEVLGSCELVVGNDSGPTHIAAAFGARTVTIFGPQLPELFRPWGNKAEVVPGKPCKYKPCRDYCHYDEPKCIIGVTSDEVFDKVCKMLVP